MRRRACTEDVGHFWEGQTGMQISNFQLGIIQVKEMRSEGKEMKSEALILATLALNTSSQKRGSIGQPRRENPTIVTGMAVGSGEEEASASLGMYRRDLLWLRLRPIAGPNHSMISRAAVRSSGEPTRAPLSRSRYHAFRARPGT